MEQLPLPAALMRPLGYPSVATLSEERQKGLRVFWLDGLFASLSGGMVDSYYTLYLLSLSASNAQIGLVNTLNQLASALMAIPGAVLADRTGQYRRLSWTTGFVARLFWILMVVAPWLLDDNGAVWLVLFAWVSMAGIGALGVAAWTALQADLVPSRLRGGYYASRNIVMQVVRLGTIPFAGLLVNEIGEPQGYQVNLTIAFALGMLSLYYYGQIPEHRVSRPEAEESLSMREALRRMRQMPTFLNFMTGHAILTLGVMTGGPFISVYMAQERGFDVGTIGIITTVNVFAGMVAMRVMGQFHDRHGITWTMRFGLGVPLITVLWLWVRDPWQGCLVNAFGALTWAGYNLGAFNLLLASTPNEHRPRYIAIHTTTISVVGAVGPIVGGWLLDATDFTTVFSLSSILRAMGLIAFFALVREPEHEAGEDGS